jgi:hypothetical protein
MGLMANAQYVPNARIVQLVDTAILENGQRENPIQSG